MNPIFEAYPEVRRYFYLAQFIVAGLILLIGVGFAAAGMDFPTWYVVTSAVSSALWSYLGLQAATNTPTTSRVRRGQAGAGELRLVLVIAAALVVGWLLITLLSRL